MILTIDSENEKLSWIIVKNPETQKNSGAAFEKPYRNGFIYGWYPKEGQFRLWFNSVGGEPSFYKNKNNNYLNGDSVYCSYGYCGIITNMLDSAIKKVGEDDVACSNRVTLSTVLISNMFIAKTFCKHFSDIGISLIPVSGKVYSVVFEGNVSLHYLLNLVLVFCLMQALEDKNIFIDLNDGIIAKYAQCLSVIDAPYYIVYTFMSRCVQDVRIFNKFASLLQKEGWSLKWGNTQKQRYNAIRGHLKNSSVLNDVGCGELFYSKFLSKNYEKIYAWDKDESLQDSNRSYLKRKGFDNIELRGFFSVESMVEDLEGTDILITEMLEHMPKDEARKVLVGLSGVNFKTLVLTVPNRTFNKNYLLGETFRHLDHFWEPTYEEAVELVRESFGNREFIVERIGDMVEGESVSTLFVFK